MKTLQLYLSIYFVPDHEQDVSRWKDLGPKFVLQVTIRAFRALEPLCVCGRVEVLSPIQINHIK